MARPVTLLVVFFISMNLLAAIIPGSALGLDTNVGGDAVRERIPEDAENDSIQSGAPTGQTLFGMYNVLSTQVSNLFSVIFPGLNMLERAGAPTEILYGVLAPLFSVLIFLDVLSFLRGWGL